MYIPLLILTSLIGDFSALHAPPGDPAAPTSAIQHFHDKLLHIKDKLKTDPGKAMGVKRHQLVSPIDGYSINSAPFNDACLARRFRTIRGRRIQISVSLVSSAA